MINYQGTFFWELLDNGRRVAHGKVRNAITTAAINAMLDSEFGGGVWYGGLIDADGYTGVSASDSMSSHTGWSEFTDYDEAVRQTWTPASAANGTLINSSAMEVTINAVGDVQGMFIASDSTKAGTSGTLWSTAILETSQGVYVGQSFRFFYQLVAREG